MPTEIRTGADAFAPGATAIDSANFGFRYTGYRDFDRFLDQTSGAQGGLIGWPGGFFAEDRPELYGYDFEGLANPASPIPPLSEMIASANDQGRSLSVTLPTMEWLDDPEAIRPLVRDFMADLLGGTWGALPETFVIELGAEYYAHLSHGEYSTEEAAPLYGRLASTMIEEIVTALEDPAINLLDADVMIGVQAGRSGDCSCRIIEAMSTDSLAEIDLLVVSRMPAFFSGVDAGMPEVEASLDTWDEAILDAGGASPGVFFTSFNVASPTREEVAADFISVKSDEGIVVTQDDLALETRTNTQFEQFWQNTLGRYALGYDQPRVLAELFSEYSAEGLVAGTAFGVDQLHPGRLSFADLGGTPVSMIGMDFLEMFYAAVDGTRMLDVSLQNSAADPYNVYAFEGQDHTAIFVMGDNHAQPVTLDIEGLSSEFTAVYVDTLTPEVPDDWMARYGIPDNAEIDETAEAETFAEGVRATQTPVVEGNSLTVQLEAPGQVIRIVLAHSAAGEEAVSEWVFDAGSALILNAPDPGDEDGPGEDEDPPPDEEPSESGDDGGIGAALLLLLPLLALAGLG